MGESAKAEIRIRCDGSEAPRVDADGVIWMDWGEDGWERITHEELGWTPHEYKSVAGVLRAVGQVVV